MSVKPATRPRCESGSHGYRLQQSARICQLGVWRMAGCRWREWLANCRTCTWSREPCLVRESNEMMCGLTFSDKAVFYLIWNGAHWRSSSLILGNYYKNEISGFKDRRWTLSPAIYDRNSSVCTKKTANTNLGRQLSALSAPEVEWGW
jgi:hypothetical protein